MFKRIKEIMKAGRTGADATEILARTYLIPVNDEILRIMNYHVKSGSADIYNAHELAIIVITDIFERFSNLPTAKDAITECIHTAKDINRRGLIAKSYVLEIFLDLAKEKFGIDSQCR